MSGRRKTIVLIIGVIVLSIVISLGVWALESLGDQEPPPVAEYTDE